MVRTYDLRGVICKVSTGFRLKREGKYGIYGKVVFDEDVFQSVKGDDWGGR